MQETTFSLNSNFKMPGLLEEDSDAFTVCAVPKSSTYQLPSMTSSQAPGNNLQISTLVKTPQGPTTPASAWGNVANCNTQKDGRESVSMCSNLASSMKSTCLDPEGTGITEYNSKDAAKNNLNSTCDKSQPETKYFTPSKQPNAKSSFLKFVDAIKKKRMVSQISNDVCLNTDAFSKPTGNRSQSQYSLKMPDVVSSIKGTSVDNSIPLASQNVCSINPSTPCFPVQAVVHSCNLVPVPKSNDNAATSSISEDVSLAVSLESSLRIIEKCQQPLSAQKADCPPTADNLPLSKAKAQASVMQRKLIKTSNDEDSEEGMIEGELDTDYSKKNNVAPKRRVINKQGKNLVKDSETTKIGLPDLPPGDLNDNSDDSVNSESLGLCLEASSWTIGCGTKSPPASALHSVVPVSRDLDSCGPSEQSRTDISKKELLQMAKVTTAFCDSPAQHSTVSVQPNTFSVRRKPIADLADSDCSDHSLPNVTPKITSVRRRRAKTTQKKSALISQTSRLVNADTENRTSLRTGDKGHMNIFSSKKEDNQCASPELRMAAEKRDGVLIKDRNKSQMNPPGKMCPKMPQSYSSDSDKVSNYMNNRRKTHKNVMPSDKIDHCGADSDPSGSNCYVNISTKKEKENQCTSPDLIRMDATKLDGTLTTKKLKGNVNLQHTMTQKIPQSNSSDSDEVSNYMNKWRKTSKDQMTSEESDSCGNDSDSSFIVETCDEDEDDLSFYLPSLTKAHIQGENKPFCHRDLGSNSEELSHYNNPQITSTSSLTKKPSNHELSDSTDSAALLEHVTIFREKIQDVCLSDSDSDNSTQSRQIKPSNVKGLISPLPANTPKPGPRKTLVCPQTVEPHKSHVLSKPTCTTDTLSWATPTLSFLASLSAQPGSSRLHPEAMPYLKNFKKNRQNLVDRLFKLFNGQCFDNELPANMSITWNVRLTKTAGFCHLAKDLSKPNSRGARVELSTKVVDNCERARDTLIHELCHAASWIVSGYKDGHGALFKSWGRRALKKFPELPAISRCHNYKISCKYTYRCTKCNSSIGRHSKSLDISRKVCGRCRGPFELLVNGKSARPGSEGVPSTPRTPAPFALYVKENYGSVKKSASALKHADVMKILGEQFKEMKT